MFTKIKVGIAEALEVCGVCPVLVDCRTAAISSEANATVFGVDSTRPHSGRPSDSTPSADEVPGDRSKGGRPGPRSA